MALPTLLDIAIASGNDALIPMIDEASRAHPEMAVVMSKPLAGRTYKTRVLTALGRTTGSFRSANQGNAAIKNVYENRQVETFILNPQFQIDKAVADSDPDGSKNYIAGERQAILEGELQGVATQFYYGIGSGNASGFPGLLDAVDSSMVIDATGTTASTGSSIWAVRSTPTDVLWRWGENGQMDLTQPIVVPILDPNDSTKTLPAYYSYLLAFPGLQIGSKFSVGRIKNLTEDSGKGATDTLVAKLFEKFLVGRPPTALFMNRRSLRQLQVSRSVTIFGQAVAPGAEVMNIGPRPTESMGIPIYVTDAITSTETIA